MASLLSSAPLTPPKPQWLRIPIGEVYDAKRLDPDGASRLLRPLSPGPARANSFAKRAGLRYEGRARKHLQDTLGPGIEFGVWFDYSDDTGARKCQVDGLYRSETGGVTIIEIKGRHTTDAWWQLRRFYYRVVKAWGAEDINLLEVCRSYDPDVKFPEQVELIDYEETLRAWCSSPSPVIGVYRWRK